jgi:glutathione peroxidase
MRIQYVLPLLVAVVACKSGNATSTSTTSASASATSSAAASTASIHSLSMKKLDGTDTSLSTYAGKVLLVVNVASECGYTPQYEGLQALHAKNEAKGFSVLGFPANDFGAQEPGTSQEIATFCKSKFGVTFPMFEKVKTIGDGRAQLFTILTDSKGPPKWNFTKYLIDKKGKPVAMWPSKVTPESPEIQRAIDEQLAL